MSFNDRDPSDTGLGGDFQIRIFTTDAPCPECGGTFDPDDPDIYHVGSDTNMALFTMRVECPHCHAPQKFHESLDDARHGGGFLEDSRVHTIDGEIP